MIIPDAEAPGGERAKILDFGIAKVAAELNGPQKASQTRTGSLLGTPTYMSPEQCRGAERVDDRADVYAFGVMLYQMLAGRPPFITESDFEMMAMHLYNSPPPLPQLLPMLSSDIVALVHATLAKSPGERPSISQVAVELQRLTTEHGQSQSALRGLPPAVASGAHRRGPAKLAVAAVLGVGAVGLLLAGRERKTPPPRPAASLTPAVEKPRPAVSAPPPPVPSDPAPAAGLSAVDHAVHGKPGSARGPKDDQDADGLKLSLNLYLQGNFNKAIRTAMPHSRESPQQAWRIIGSAACHLKKLQLLNEAYRRVDEGGRKYIVLVCQSQGLALSAKQEFEVAK